MMEKNVRAFTLIELLVVVAIIIILAALVMPAIHLALGKTTKVAALNNMRQVGIAFLSYATDANFTFPKRIGDGDRSSMKWPGLIAGYDNAGGYSAGDDYVKSMKVYIAPGYGQVDTGRKDLAQFLTSNSPNNTSWIMNGYNDIGTRKYPKMDIPMASFSSLSETLLLAMHQPGKDHFYMDFDDGDNKSVLELHAYGKGAGAGSVYCFTDGSARFITEADYNKPAPGGSGRYGDWLWLANKNSPVPN